MAFIEPMHRNKPNITYLLTLVLCCLACRDVMVSGRAEVTSFFEIRNYMAIEMINSNPNSFISIPIPFFSIPFHY